MKRILLFISLLISLFVEAQVSAKRQVFSNNSGIVNPPCGGTANLFVTAIPLTDAFQRSHGGTDRWNENSGGQIVSGIPTPPVYYRRFFVSDMFNSDGTHKLNGLLRTKMTDAANAGQLFGFRMATLYPGPDLGGFHTIYSYDGNFSVYPEEWHTAMQAEGSIDNRDFNDGESWIPGYNGTAFKTRYAAAWVTVDSWFDTAFIRPTSGSKVGQSIPAKDMISYIDISGVGSYGEMHHCCLGEGKDNLHGSPTDANGWRYNDESDGGADTQGRVPSVASWKAIIDMQVNVLDWAHWVAVINILDGKRFQNTEIPVEVGIYVLTKYNTAGRVGLRRDQFGNDDSYYHQILEQNTMSFGGVRADTAILNTQKYAYFVAEPQGGPATSGDCGNGHNMGCAPGQVVRYGMFSFGNGNYGGTPTGAGADSVRHAARIAGPIIRINGGSMSATLQVNTSFNVTVRYQNLGVATDHRNWTVQYELRNSSNVTVWTGTPSFTVKGFIPAITEESVSSNFVLPLGIPSGLYRLVIRIVDPTNYLDPFRLGITGRESDGAYQLRNNITVGTCT